MKIVKCISILFAATSANAFQPVVVVRSRLTTMQLSVSADDDAEKLETMSKTWEELRRKEKEVERSHDEVSLFLLWLLLHLTGFIAKAAIRSTCMCQ